MRALGTTCPSAEHETSQVPTSSFCARCVLRPRQSVSPSHRGTAHVAFDVAYRLGLCGIMAFAAQQHTPHNRCVRFAPAVAGDHATLAAGRPLRLTRTGLSPAGPRQLTWRTSNPFFLRGEMDCFAEPVIGRAFARPVGSQ